MAEDITKFEIDMDGDIVPSENGRWVRYDDHLEVVAAQRKPLTDEEIEAMWPLRPTDAIIQFARAIEAAHGIKETP